MPVNYGLLQVAPNRISGNLSLATPQTDDTLQKAASGVASTANSFLKELVDQANRTRVQDAINQYSEDLDHFKYDRDTGMMRRKGRDVALPESGEAFSVEGERGVEERIGKYFGGLNQAQQDLAKDFLSRTRASNRNDFLRHEAAECDNYTVDVSDAAIKRARNSLAQNGMYKEAREADIQTIRDSYAAIGRIRGWSDEHVKNSADEAISGSIKDVVGVLLDDGNVSAATKLFNEAGRGGNLLGRDMIALRRRITKMREAAAQKAEAEAVVRDLEVAAAPELSMIQAMRKEGLALPELDRLLAGEKDPRKRLRIQQSWFGKLLQKAGGDRLTAVALATGLDARTAGGTEGAERLKAAERAAKAADVLPTYTVPEVGEIALRIRELRPDLPEEKVTRLASDAHKAMEGRMASQALLADAQAGRAFAAIEQGASLSQVDTSLMTAEQIQALETRERKARSGELDVGDDATYWRVMSEPEQLAQKTEAQVRTLLASCSDEQIARALQLRQAVRANGGKVGYTKDAPIEAAFDAALRNAQSPLVSDSKYKHVRAQYLDWVTQQIHALETEAGRGLDPKMLGTEMARLVQHAIFFKDGPSIASGKQPDFSAVPEAEHVLKEYCVSRLGIAEPKSGEMLQAAWWLTSMHPGHQVTVAEAHRLLPEWYWDRRVPDQLKTAGMQQQAFGQAILRDYLWFAMDADGYKTAQKRASQESAGASSETDLIEGPTIDLSARPIVQNADGSVSTVRSITAEIDGAYYVIPTVINGRVINDNEVAINYAMAHGEHLGKYRTQDAADAAARRIHRQEEERVRSMR